MCGCIHLVRQDTSIVWVTTEGNPRLLDTLHMAIATLSVWNGISYLIGSHNGLAGAISWYAPSLQLVDFQSECQTLQDYQSELILASTSEV